MAMRSDLRRRTTISLTTPESSNGSNESKRTGLGRTRGAIDSLEVIGKEVRKNVNGPRSSAAENQRG
jgi:hypothetical protein